MAAGPIPDVIRAGGGVEIRTGGAFHRPLSWRFSATTRVVFAQACDPAGKQLLSTFWDRPQSY